MATRSDTNRIDATVLVVDDDDDFRAALAETLEEEGCDVVDARTGEAALALLDDATKGRTPGSGSPGPRLAHAEDEWDRGPSEAAKIPKAGELAGSGRAVNDQMLPVRLDVPVAFKPDVQVVLDAVRQQLARAGGRRPSRRPPRKTVLGRNDR